ncbi:MAG: hypothetical protein WBZ11_08065 [Candidatus Sulfotelmatobacter sp.]|jgi:hypothetical protein
MKRHVCRFRLAAVLSLLLCVSYAAAETLTGRVTNATTGKPAANDEVILLKLGQGMEEADHGRTDSKGNFSLKLDDPQSPHLVRVIHQAVTYHRMAPPGTTSVAVEVFDVSQKVQGVATTADVMHFETSQGKLEVQRLFAVNNSSQPRRTQMNDKNFEFYLPEGAKITQGSAMTAGGQPIALSPVPEGGDGKYAFIFPLRPGETRFEVDYELPYNGSAAVTTRPVAPVQSFIVIAPKTMQFSSSGPAFQEMNDPQQPGVLTQLASNVAAGQSLSFRISGEGTLPQENADAGGPAQDGGNPTGAAPANAPGGGLGPPIDAPDPLQKYRWYILGGFAGMLLVGAIVIARRQQSGTQRGSLVDPYASQESDGRSLPRHQSGINGNASTNSKVNLLEGLKNEYFELEVEHQRGLISNDDYEKTKAALDHTLKRALRKQITASEIENPE